MTAKQQKDAAFIEGFHVDGCNGGYYYFNADELKAFCEQLCLEQRKICAKTVWTLKSPGSPLKLEADILNAPTPDL